MQHRVPYSPVCELRCASVHHKAGHPAWAGVLNDLFDVFAAFDSWKVELLFPLRDVKFARGVGDPRLETLKSCGVIAKDLNAQLV